jgi:hypothetical protein
MALGVDMVVYGPAERKDLMPFLASIEFKKWWPSISDRNRGHSVECDLNNAKRKASCGQVVR